MSPAPCRLLINARQARPNRIKSLKRSNSAWPQRRAVVADVNGFGYHSKGLNPKEIAKILIDNPFGNASQKTPIVVIKNYAQFVKNRKKD